jgi:glutamate carboxypeptidase
MGELSSIEAAAVERAQAAPMLDQVQSWSAINSGSRNLAGLRADGGPARGELAALPGRAAAARAQRPIRCEATAPCRPLEHGRNLHLTCGRRRRCSCFSPAITTRSFAADHPFQQVFWRSEGVLGGPGVADMKGGIAVMLAALRAVEASPLARRSVTKWCSTATRRSARRARLRSSLRQRAASGRR